MFTQPIWTPLGHLFCQYQHVSVLYFYSTHRGDTDNAPLSSHRDAYWPFLFCFSTQDSKCGFRRENTGDSWQCLTTAKYCIDTRPSIEGRDLLMSAYSESQAWYGALETREVYVQCVWHLKTCMCSMAPNRDNYENTPFLLCSAPGPGFLPR